MDFAHERIFEFLRSATIREGKVRSNEGEAPADVLECRGFDSLNPYYGNRKREDMEEFVMLEILKYIFSSFWVFSGTVVLIWSIGIMLTLICYAIFGERKKK